VSNRNRRSFLCGIRKSLDGGFTYGAGGWPFAQAVIEENRLRVGPALASLSVLMVVGLAGAALARQWVPLLLVLAGLFGIAATPRRTYPFSTLRVQRRNVGVSKAVELSDAESGDRIWLWFIPMDSFVGELRSRGVAIDDEPRQRAPSRLEE